MINTFSSGWGNTLLVRGFLERQAPITNATHSWPVNALLDYEYTYFVDLGDIAAGRLVTAGGSIHNVRGVFLSHLHFDHASGVSANIAETRLRNYHVTPEQVGDME